jgi:hypothetical protein
LENAGMKREAISAVIYSAVIGKFLSLSAIKQPESWSESSPAAPLILFSLNFKKPGLEIKSGLLRE